MFLTVKLFSALVGAEELGAGIMVVRGAITAAVCYLDSSMSIFFQVHKNDQNSVGF